MRLLLQWRAGQLPGQTSGSGAALGDGLHDAFNGGPGNCPAKPARRRRATADTSTFNGGPGNCPAKPPRSPPWSSGPLSLQWRAGQLPGQTVVVTVRFGSELLPSMEGRAIARPNGLPARRGVPRLVAPFNGGPGNCPAKRDLLFNQKRDGSPSMEGRAIARPNDPDLAHLVGRNMWPSMEGRAIARPNDGGDTSAGGGSPLQWRAGQLPGQTPTTTGTPGSGSLAFNGGPGNCPAKPVICG